MALTAHDCAAEWRFEDLFDRHDLPELARYEVVDGHLVVTPPPSHRHQMACAQLLVQLSADCPHDWFVAQDFGLRLGDDGRVPDLAAVRRGAALARGPLPYGPDAFGLVVEVTSPSTRKTDLFAKPGEYAEAGIPLFWRLDLDPVPTLHAFVLREGSYVEVAAVTDVGAVPVPWGEVELDLRGLAGDLRGD